MWLQKTISLRSRSRGFHLVTHDIVKAVPEIRDIGQGLMHLLLLHTSASLSLNENADPDVLIDLESYFNHSVPEDAPYFRHTLEGQDDMPAHIKQALVGAELTLPVQGGELQLGTWQGIVLGEHRDRADQRKIHVTLWGET